MITTQYCADHCNWTGLPLRVTEEIPINRAGVAGFATADAAVVYHPIVNELRGLLIVDETGIARALLSTPPFMNVRASRPTGNTLPSRSTASGRKRTSNSTCIMTSGFSRYRMDRFSSFPARYSNRCAQWTSDSRNVIYRSQWVRRRTHELWVQPIDGSTPEQPLVPTRSCTQVSKSR